MKINSGQAPSTLVPKYIGSDFDKVVDVATNIEDVKTVAKDIENVGIVADNIGAVNNTGNNIDDVTKVSDNIDYVKDVAQGIEGLPVISYIGDEPPKHPAVGASWYCTTDGRTYVWYEDIDSKQWVESSPQSVGDDKVRTDVVARASMERSLKLDGLTLVDGSFELGAVLNSATDVILHESAGNVYSWTGAFPATVPAGSTPSSTGGIGEGKWMSRFDPVMRQQVREALRRSYAEAGYNLVAGSLEAGGTLVNANDVLLQESTGKAFSGPTGTVAAGTNPAGGGFISRANAPQLDKSDIARFGYVYGSGVDGKNAVLAAITATGIAHISGPTTLSRFDWPQGAKITGNAPITYSRLPAVPCVLDSSISVDLSKMKAVFVHQVYDICDMLQLKSAGFNTIIHYGQFGGTSGNMTKACNAADAIGIKMILGGPLYGQTDTPAQDLNGRDCVIGYYLYDEPQNAGVTVAAQQARINAFRAFTSKKLVMTDHNQFSFDSSTVPSGVGAPGYDIIFVDKYYHDAQTEEFIKRDAIAAWGELAHKTVNAEIMPCVGAFSTDLNGGSDAFKNKSKQISFAKQFFKMGDGGYAAFSWESNLIVNTHRTITIDTDFYALIKGLNGVMIQNPFETETVAFDKKTLIELMAIRDAVYSSPDVTPFAVVNAGSNINERQNTFADAGLAVRNSGGLLATKLRSSGCVVIEFFFQNYVDATAVTYSLTTSPDDFYTVTESLTKSVSSASSFWTGIVETTKDQAIGIRCTPAASYVNRWKFLRGGMVICSWSGLGF